VPRPGALQVHGPTRRPRDASAENPTKDSVLTAAFTWNLPVHPIGRTWVEAWSRCWKWISCTWRRLMQWANCAHCRNQWRGRCVWNYEPLLGPGSTFEERQRNNVLFGPEQVPLLESFVPRRKGW